MNWLESMARIEDLEDVRLDAGLVAEFEDSALAKVFAQHGHGIFAAPSLLAQELRDQYGVRAIGDADGVIERYYAISVERRIKHPAVAAITEAARERIFKRG